MGLRDKVDATIDAALGSRIVGCVVLINQDGKRVYERAAGLADREAGVATGLNTIFRLASVTKPIVAATTLRMIDKGLLSLDDRVADYLPYFTPKAPDGSTPDITIRQLLQHRSGVFNYFESARYARQGDWKITSMGDTTWHLFNLAEDRTETTDLREQNPAKVKELAALWRSWANTHNVFPKPGRKAAKNAEN